MRAVAAMLPHFWGDIIAVLQRFAADTVIVSDLVYPNDAPIGNNDYPASEKLGMLGPVLGKATPGFQRASSLGGWRYKDPIEEIDRQRLGGLTPE